MAEIIEMKKVVEAKTETPQIIFGLIDCGFSTMRDKAWDVISSYVKEFADKSNGEYTAYHVREMIRLGHAILFMGYLDTEGKTKNKTSQDALIDYIARGNKDFAGYAVVRFDLISVHIWQAYIKEEFQNANIAEAAFAHIEKEMIRFKVPYMTFSSPRAGWSHICKKLGFEEIYTIYRKKMENS